MHKNLLERTEAAATHLAATQTKAMLTSSPTIIPLLAANRISPLLAHPAFHVESLVASSLLRVAARVAALGSPGGRAVPADVGHRQKDPQIRA